VAGFHRRHISQGCDQDYDNDHNNAGHTLVGLAGSWFCSSVTVPLICAHP
jgi:hypothetical protein